MQCGVIEVSDEDIDIGGTASKQVHANGFEFRLASGDKKEARSIRCHLSKDGHGYGGSGAKDKSGFGQ